MIVMTFQEPKLNLLHRNTPGPPRKHRRSVDVNRRKLLSMIMI